MTFTNLLVRYFKICCGISKSHHEYTYDEKSLSQMAFTAFIAKLDKTGKK